MASRALSARSCARSTRAARAFRTRKVRRGPILFVVLAAVVAAVVVQQDASSSESTAGVATGVAAGARRA